MNNCATCGTRHSESECEQKCGQKTVIISVELYKYLVQNTLEQDNDFPAGWNDYIDIDTL